MGTMRHMSVQARRRLNECLHGQDLIDLAAEIADALQHEDPIGKIYGEAERTVILRALARPANWGRSLP